ncbi:MAG: hypothetical protein J1E41_07720, partial [Ruminococcus sp.]|nr:hypothetical protein [Ruminococcus sp.]
MEKSKILTDGQTNRGFITVATGNIYYYELAANLLKSYKYTTKKQMPFAIICDEENEYTELFDVVIVTKEVFRSYLDKLLLLKLCPFDENIFIDSDILAYNDLNNYWEFFQDATDFSSIGENFELHDDGAWYNVEDIGEFGNKITYKVRVHMGVCFIRKSPHLDKLYNDCIDILNNYDKLYFHTCPNNKDEATLGVAMPMNNMKATLETPESMGFLRCLTSVSANIIKKRLSYTTQWGTSVKDNGWVLHFGSKYTHQPLYKFEVECLNKLLLNKQNSLVFIIRYKLGTRKLSLKLSW